MKKWILAAVFCVSASAAFGQLGEIGASFGQSRMRNNDIGDAGGGVRLKIQDGFRFGFRFTVNSSRFFGHEFGYAYNRGNLRYDTQPPQEFGNAVHQGFYDFLIYALPEGSVVRPFAAGGGHFSTFPVPGISATYGGVTKFGYNYGGGIKIRVHPLFLIRLDLRDYVTGKPFDLADQKGLLRQLEVSGGFALVF